MQPSKLAIIPSNVKWISRCFISITWGRTRGCGHWRRAAFFAGAGPFLDQIKHRWDQENAEGSGSEHAADDDRADDLTRNRPATRGDPQRNVAKNEREGGH